MGAPWGTRILTTAAHGRSPFLAVNNAACVTPLVAASNAGVTIRNYRSRCAEMSSGGRHRRPQSHQCGADLPTKAAANSPTAHGTRSRACSAGLDRRASGALGSRPGVLASHGVAHRPRHYPQATVFHGRRGPCSQAGPRPGCVDRTGVRSLTTRNRADNTYFLHVFALTPRHRLASVK